ncbi:RepB family plasmid replication initiator protein (plasmid) [Roseovarius faecimaris]|uniref:RepB family plasmid replication initiator protein n=1 Tax=Roseovarius faecimaris TaxID=2494550 RepID=A0A6I6ILP1_9RHOB|nr:replication initiator protein A [Roseovarius faecimaris]QGX96781.1 RepB family plasmid replication initiator protein [Roseovarius faecimaris]
MAQQGLLPTRHPTADFFICDIFGASPKDDLGTMEHPIFSLSTRPDRRILRYTHNDVTVEVTPSVRGRATIHDKDILIYCVSQLMAALNKGRATSRVLHLTAHDLLVATNRDTSGDGYMRLREAFERLAGTRITTNLQTGGEETTRGFGLIEAWEIVRKSRGGRMVSVTVTLSEWLYRAVLSKSVLTLSRDYFRLRKPLERRIYELARKHCGRQPGWTVSVATLHKKSGSAAPLRVFRAALRRMITEAHLPDYTMAEAPGDLIRFARIGKRPAAAPHLAPETLEEARQLAPGADVYALQAEWLSWWEASGRTRLSNPDRAFLGWLHKRRG